MLGKKKEKKADISLAYRIFRVGSSIPYTAKIIRRYQAGYKNMATVTVFLDEADHHYRYFIEEPPVSPQVEKLYSLVRERFQSLEIEIPEGAVSVENIYEHYIHEALSELGFEDAYEKYPELSYYIIRDIVGWRVIDVLMRDPYVEEIDMPMPDRPISIVHKFTNIPVKWVDTNIVLNEKEAVDLIEFLAFKTGKQINVASPILEAQTPEGYRVAANLREVGRSPNFTIRKHTKKPFSLVFLVRNKTISPLIAAYLWTMVENMKFIMVVGGMGSGKTTTLQAMTSLIPQDKKVVTIEDTPELKLNHPRWQALYTRRSLYGSEQDVDLETLARYSLRTRADYVIIGEVRDKEMNVLVQIAASGHGSACTFHSTDPHTMFVRMMSPPLNVQPAFLPVISAVLFMAEVKVPGRLGTVRRMIKVWEITGLKKMVNVADVPVDYTEIFTWDAQEDKHYPETVEELLEKSYHLRNIGMFKYGEENWWDMMKWELEEKKKFIEYLVKEGIEDFEQVTEMIYRKTLELQNATPARIIARSR